MEKKKQQLPWTQFLAAFSTTMGALGLGCGVGWSSPALPQLVNCNLTNESAILSMDGSCTLNTSFTSTEGSWIASIYTLGALVSGPVTGLLLNWRGCRGAMLIMALPFTAGWSLLALITPLGLNEANYFYLARFLTGLGGGAFVLAAAIYINEIAETRFKGGLSAGVQMMITVGNIFVNALGSFIAWPFITALCVIFPLLMALLMLFMPESPFHLLMNHRYEHAAKALKWLRKNQDEQRVMEELEEIRESVERTRSLGQNVSTKDLLSKSEYSEPFFVVLGLMALQQFCGINVIVFYLSQIFVKAGLDVSNALLAGAAVSLTQVVGTGASMFVVDRFGRRPMLMLSSLLMSVSITALGAYFLLSDHIICGNSPKSMQILSKAALDLHCNPQSGWVSRQFVESLALMPLIALISYKFGFSIGFGPMPWVLNAELCSPEAKQRASAIATAFNWFCAFLVTRFSPLFESLVGTATMYFCFGGVCVLSLSFVVLLVPETKGKSADDIREHFKHKHKQLKESSYGSI